VKAPTDDKEALNFRNAVISQVGAWALDHPGETVQYQEVFPEHWKKLEDHYYEGQKAELQKMYNALQVDQDGSKSDTASEGAKLAKTTVERMKRDLNYCDHCAKEVITFLMKKRY